MKRANGMGSVVKLSGKRRRPYAVKISQGLDIDRGVRIRKYLAYFEDRKDAELYLAKYNKKMIDTRRMPTISDLYERFYKLKTLVDNRAEKTIKMYERKGY